MTMYLRISTCESYIFISDFFDLNPSNKSLRMETYKKYFIVTYPDIAYSCGSMIR